MIKRNVKEVEFVFAKDEFSYQEVLDSFEKAKYINILTFNISSKYNYELTNKLKNLNENCMVNIVTNIPNRFYVYKGKNKEVKKYRKKIAKETVRNYIERLNPEKFKCNLNTYFNFDNHGKIIMTNSIAYVGSANFSSESMKNIETGFLSKDLELINYLNDEFFPSIINNSRNYSFDEDLLLIESEIIRIGKLIRYNREDLLNNNFYYEDYHGKEVPVLSNENCYFSIDVLYELLEIAEEFHQLVGWINNLLKWKEEEFLEISRDIVNDIRKLTDEDSLLFKLSSGQISSERFLESDIDAYDEGFEKSCDEAINRCSDLDADEEIRLLCLKFKQLHGLCRVLYEKFDNVYTQNKTDR